MVFENYYEKILLRADQIKEVEKFEGKKTKKYRYKLKVYMINGDIWTLKYETEDHRSHDYYDLKDLLQKYKD